MNSFFAFGWERNDAVEKGSEGSGGSPPLRDPF